MKRAWGRGTEGDLYESLSGADDNVFRMGCSFYEFKTRYLPILKGSSEEKKMKIVRESNLTESEMELLGVDPDDYEEWKEGGDIDVAEQKSQEQQSDVNSFMEW